MRDANEIKSPEAKNHSSARTRVAPKEKRRGPFFYLAWLGAGLLVLGAVSSLWLITRASLISSNLEAAMTLVPQLKDEMLKNDSNSGNTVEQIRGHASSARQAADDPLWVLAGGLPYIGVNFQAVSTMATSADDISGLGAAPLVSVSQSFEWGELLPKSTGVELQQLTAAKPKLISAAHAVAQSVDRLEGINTDALWPQVAAPLSKAHEQLNALRRELDVAASAASLAPDMLGGSTPRRYLLLVQNNAETRASGGIPGALAVMEADGGRLALQEQSSATELGSMAPVISFDSEQKQIYSGRMGKFMQDVNLTPDFPTTASIARDMWKQKTNEQLDGVVSIDPVALGYLLEGTGPVRLSDPRMEDLVSGTLPTTLNKDNVVPTLLSGVYAAIPEPALQDLYFASVAKEVFSAISSDGNDPRKLFAGITRGVQDGRIKIWSSNPDEQAVISKYPISGSISGVSIAPAQFGVYFNDGTGAKMDYYVKRTVQLVKECTANGYAEVKIRVTSTNTAPKDAATSLPAYVTGGGAFGVPAGSVQTNIVAYGPVQSNVEAAYVAGRKTSFASQRHAGRPVGTMTVRLAPGQQSTVEFIFGKIVQHTEPVLAVTPTVQGPKDVVLQTETTACAPLDQPAH